MFWRVLTDGSGYRAGDILDLGDAEAAEQVARLVAITPADAPLPPEPVAEPEPVAAAKPVQLGLEAA